ncbi:MAG: arginine--tRNA ligase, partial [Caldiserica bacterium]
MRKILEKRIKKSIGLDVPLSFPPDWVDADFSTNISFKIAKEENKKVEDVAVEVIGKLKNMYEFKEVYFLKPGFINFKISDDFIIEEFLEFSKDIDEYIKRNVGREKKRILIECVSANPTGPLHIGHGRGGVIGDGLRGVFEFLGFDVSFEYYVNNRGRQIELLGSSLKARYEGENPPEDGYKGDYLIRIAEKLKREKREIKNWGEVAVNEILSIIKEELSMFGMKFDSFFHETELYRDGTVEEVLNVLKEKDLIYEKDDAVWFKAKEFGDTEDRVIIKADGNPTYFLSDIAYHYEKLRRGYNLLINIWGADHHGYVKRIEAGIQALTGKKDVLNVILYQLVRIKRGKEIVSMSTREGEFVELRKVIDEVGKDVARIYLLLKRYSTPLDFDLEEAKKKS